MKKVLLMCAGSRWMRTDRRLLLAVAATAMLTCHAQASRPTPRPTAPAPSSPPASTSGFDPAVARPSAAIAQVREALDRDDPAEAARRARAALEGADRSEASRLRWLLARAALAADRVPEAIGHLRAIERSKAPLAPWATLEHAGRISDKDPATALQLVSPLAGRPWAGRDRARIVEAEILVATGRDAEAIPKLRALMEDVPDHVGGASAAMPLAALLARRADDGDALEEALALYRRVATRAPLTAVGRRAEQRARQVLASLPADRRKALAPMPPEDAFARAHALYDAMRHEEAAGEFEQLAKRFQDDAGRRCEARLYQGKALLRQRERAEAAKLLEDVAERCPDRDDRARARFLTARAHARLGNDAEAIAHYAVVEREAPKHRLADDALFRAALAARDEGDTETMERRLSELPTKYPDGDMRSEARFLLAWRARAEKRWDDALGQLDRLLAEGPDERREGEQGRVAYWRARTLQDAGRTNEATEAYAGIVRRWPLAYHAQQALSRLDELAPDRARAERARFRRQQGGETHRLTFPVRPELSEAAFERALDLLRVGEVDRAVAELEHMGALGAGADRDLLWLVAAVLDRAGAHPQASRLVRTRLTSFRSTVPTGRARQLWRLAYPRAFEPLIEEVAAEMEVPATYVRAVAREESAFDPNAVSVARARGLIQLMGPTAARFARDLNLPTDPASLHDPEINVRIGSRFIAYLWSRYRSNPAVVPAAYNAGEGAASRWLRARPDLPLDTWIEEIPYDETRRYTRRVLETWGIYRYLDGGEVPTLDPELPEG